MERRTYIFAGGGTGGHLYPGISVAKALLQMEPKSEVCFFCTTREVDRKLLEPTPFSPTRQCVRPLPTRPWQVPGFLWNWFRSVSAAKAFIRAKRPAAILGLGGYAAGPAVVAGQGMGVRTAILNPDAIPGYANRKLAKGAELVVLQWEDSRRHFPEGTKCQALGCPVRDAFGPVEQAAARRQFGLDAERPTLLVTGASQGARTVNQAMTALWPEFQQRHPEWQVLHLTGDTEAAAVRAAYGAHLAKPPQGRGQASIGSVHVLDFTHSMHVALGAADLVVSRAGASTLAELTLLGKASILLPYPFIRDRHQHANGQVLVDAGAAVMMDDLIDAEKNREPLLIALSKLAGDAKRREKMAESAKKLGRPRAAEDVARWMAGG